MDKNDETKALENSFPSKLKVKLSISKNIDYCRLQLRKMLIRFIRRTYWKTFLSFRSKCFKEKKFNHRWVKQHKFKILFVNFSFYKWHLSIDEFTSETLNRYKIHYIAQSSSIFDQEFFPLVFQRTFSCESATRLKSQMLTSNVMTSYSWGKKASTSRALRTESMSALQSLNVSTKLSKAK